MTRRNGITLTEVLVAIFIMALGLMALLTLFPLGALRMFQAVKDDRTKFTADSAHVLARWWWRELWLDPNGNQIPESSATGRSVTRYEPFALALDNNLASPYP